VVAFFVVVELVMLMGVVRALLLLLSICCCSPHANKACPYSCFFSNSILIFVNFKKKKENIEKFIHGLQDNDYWIGYGMCVIFGARVYGHRH